MSIPSDEITSKYVQSSELELHISAVQLHTTLAQRMDALDETFRLMPNHHADFRADEEIEPAIHPELGLLDRSDHHATGPVQPE